MNTFYKKYLLEATRYRGGDARPESQENLIKLSSNENQFGPSPDALEAIRSSLYRLHEYPDNDDSRLSKALVKYYQNKLEVDHFFCAPAGSEIIELICRAFLNAGEEVIVCNPSFIPFRVFSEKMGARIVQVPLDAKTFEFNIPLILKNITPKTRLVFLASPNNPTGNIICRSDLERLLANLPQQVILVYDEVYHHYVQASSYSRAIDFVNKNQNILAVNSFSKVFGLAGLRLGYGYGPPKLVRYIRCLLKPFLNSTLAISGGIAALNDEQFLLKSIENNSTQKRLFYELFTEVGLKYWPSEANFILVKPEIPVKAFCRFLLTQSIMVRPVQIDGDLYVRITIGIPAQNQKLFQALRTIHENQSLIYQGISLN